MRRSTFGDNRERLVSGLKEALTRADLVVTIGGLGPTVDDLTRDAIAEALDDQLVYMPEYEALLRETFEKRSIRWSESIARQAYRPSCAEVIENPYGTAPGLYARKDGKIIIATPGPKGEFEPMVNGPVRDILSKLEGGVVIHSRTLRIVGMGESHVEDLIRELMDSEQPTVAPYAHPGEVHLRITARANSIDEAEGIIQPVEDQIRKILGANVFGTDKTTLEEFMVEALGKRNQTISVAESMSGGLLAARFVSIPGASKVFLGGTVAYTATTKTQLLGIDPALISEFGPVSPEVVQAMAESIRTKTGSDFSLAITGNAGPTEDAGGAGLGQVYVALAWDGPTKVDSFKYRSERGETQRRSTQMALNLLRDHLLEH